MSQMGIYRSRSRLRRARLLRLILRWCSVLYDDYTKWLNAASLLGRRPKLRSGSIRSLLSKVCYDCNAFGRIRRSAGIRSHHSAAAVLWGAFPRLAGGYYHADVHIFRRAAAVGAGVGPAQ